MRLRSKLAAVALGAAAVAAALGGDAANAQQLDRRQFNVVGTWSFLTNWQKLEQSLWTKTLPEASGGKITGNVKSITGLNLEGTEVLRLMKQGVFDVAAALPTYVEEGEAVAEASDIAGVAKDFKMARDVTAAWMPEMQKALKGKHNALILGTFPFSEQAFFCRGDIKGVDDLKGKKVRVQGVSQGDFVSALGGVGVTIAFGEVVSALQKGVVDCGITGTMPGYKARWPEVTDTLFRLPVGYNIGFWVVNQTVWGELSKDTQEFLTMQMRRHEDKSWKVIEDETEEGVACSTGAGPCAVGAAGMLKLVKPSESDLRAREKALNEVVLARWAERCGTACASRWNELVGKRYGLTAKAK